MKSITTTVLIFLGFILSTNAQSVPFYVPTSGLVGWWPFNGNANDESGNGLNGNVSNATLANDRQNNPNKAYYFDGNGDQIITNASSKFSSDSITISFWMKITSQSVYHQIQVAKNSNGPLARGFALNDSRIAYVPAKSDCSTSSTVGFSNSGIQTNVWTHVAFIVNANFTVIYINGSKADSVKNGAVGCTSLMQLVIGNDIGGGASEWFNGYFDDKGFWNRALTKEEVLDLYNSCTVSFVSQPIDQKSVIGKDIKFSALTNDTLTKFQWQSNSNFLGWMNVPNNISYSGATSVKLIVI